MWSKGQASLSDTYHLQVEGTMWYVDLPRQACLADRTQDTTGRNSSIVNVDRKNDLPGTIFSQLS